VARRKERKAALRREREERARQARAAERRKRLAGYGLGAALAAAALGVAIVALASGGGGPSGEGFPAGGQVPRQRVVDLVEAAKAAGCELKSFPGEPPEHTSDPSETIAYNSNPPTNGKHFQVPVEDGAYAEAADTEEVVHALEHGRVVWWFRPAVPDPVKADLKALFDADNYQLVMTRNATRMPYAVAASAWNGQPEPNGTGRLLGCRRVSDGVLDALRAFSDEHRGNGLEPVP